MSSIDRRSFIVGSSSVALILAWNLGGAEDSAGISSASDVPRGPFDKQTTAEQATAGLDLSGKTALITGCSSGIGLETMRVLALRGAHVIGTARTMDKARQACEFVLGPDIRGTTAPLEC